MSAFSVPLDGLVDVVDHLVGLERQLDERMAEVDTRVGQLHGVWSGAAADEHRLAHRQWLAGAREMQEALTTLRGIVSTSHANYSSAVSANQRMWA